MRLPRSSGRGDRALPRLLGQRRDHRGHPHRPPPQRHLRLPLAYDENGVAIWPAEALNFTTKTQYLFRINKNAVRPDQREVVNLHIPQEYLPFPFENMAYLGDGETDVPCFSLVEDKGGLAITVARPAPGATSKRGRSTPSPRPTTAPASPWTA